LAVGAGERLVELLQSPTAGALTVQKSAHRAARRAAVGEVDSGALRAERTCFLLAEDGRQLATSVAVRVGEADLVEAGQADRAFRPSTLGSASVPQRLQGTLAMP
jgi:hypothetical protein